VTEPARGLPASASVAAPGVDAFGDSAVLVTLGTRPDPVVTAHARGLATRLHAARPRHPGLGRPVPAHASVLVPIDPLLLTADDAVALLREWLVAEDNAAGAAVGRPTDAANSDDREPRLVELAVRYGGAEGPDLEAIAELHGLQPGDVAELHASVTYEVLFLGFAPGFAYLGGLPDDLVTPRRETPRERVPAGTVAIAGSHTAVYPGPLPGGWQLIGRTDAVLFDARLDEPALFVPGGHVRFIPAR
jgi:KipI family sensor histidine kinase inhibitor